MKSIREQGVYSIIDSTPVHTFWYDIVDEMVGIGGYDTADEVVDAIEIEFGFSYNDENVDDSFDWGRREAIRVIASIIVEDYEDFTNGYIGIKDGAEFWGNEIDGMINDRSRGYESIQHIAERIYDTSDWMENGFNEKEVSGMESAIMEMVEAAWNASDRA